MATAAPRHSSCLPTDQALLDFLILSDHDDAVVADGELLRIVLGVKTNAGKLGNVHVLVDDAPMQPSTPARS